MIKKLKRVMIKEEFARLTGDVVKAIILNQFIYWSERVSDFDTFITEEKSRAGQSGTNVMIEPTNGWIYKTAEELSDETMLNMAPNTILRHIKFLIDRGWLDERNNPVHRWDRTKQYRVNLLKIHQDLCEIGYTLQDYKIDLPFSKIENAFSKMENGSSKIENGISELENRTLQNGKAIPEITTKDNKHSSNQPSIHHDEDDARARAKVSAEQVVDSIDGVDNSKRFPCDDASNLGNLRKIESLIKAAGFEGLQVEVEFIGRWVDIFPFEMIEYALKKAILSGKKNLYYVEGIFDKWLKKGVRTLEDAKKETRYDFKPLSSPEEKNQDPKRIIKLPDPQVFKDYINRNGG